MSLLDNDFDITPADLMINICKRFLSNHDGYSEKIINNTEITIEPDINELCLFENPNDYILRYYFNFIGEGDEYLKCCIQHKEDLNYIRYSVIYTDINDILNYMKNEYIR